MKIFKIDGKNYRLSGNLNDFQLKMYVHLINWKWQHITSEPGEAGEQKYDAILPDEMAKRREWPHIYPDVHKALRAHMLKNDFRIHKHFYHMASSQAANINLFLPVLHHPSVNAILGAIKPDFASLATDCLDNGYCIEFWGGNFDKGSITSGNAGLLGDKSTAAGTDSDIAIAYRNHRGELCLWLIEHKLTEKEFTTCGGSKSKGRTRHHNCEKKFADIVGDKSSCYYHDVCKYKYWEITDANRAFFSNHSTQALCPFYGGMNQLWRNQLLALSIEQDDRQRYKHVTFSVVKHPMNCHLDATMNAYKDLIGKNPKFSVFTSADVIDAAAKCGDASLGKWIKWYEELYTITAN